MKPSVTVILVVDLTSLFWHFAEMENADQFRQNACHAYLVQTVRVQWRFLLMFLYIMQSLQTRVLV